MNSFAQTTESCRVIITSGEPAGIGPDLCIKLSQYDIDAQLLVLGNKELITERAEQLAINTRINVIESLDSKIPEQQRGQINLYNIALPEKVQAGTLNVANAEFVIKQLDIAVAACSSGQFDAMVTGPVHKGVINDAGLPFTGHTEYLAEKTGTPLPVMLLQTPGLRVALATTHLPLKQVPEKLTVELLEKVIAVLHHDLVNRYSIAEPQILVCGLNPHAGESGHLGDEEIRIIEPVLKQCRQQGIKVIGPLSADTIFSEENLQCADVFLAMYHDQGLPVIKYRGFGETVNVTLGLPLIRTSVDHGTALTLAATGKADERSFLQAINTARDLANHHQ